MQLHEFINVTSHGAPKIRLLCSSVKAARTPSCISTRRPHNTPDETWMGRHHIPHPRLESVTMLYVCAAWATCPKYARTTYCTSGTHPRTTGARTTDRQHTLFFDIVFRNTIIVSKNVIRLEYEESVEMILSKGININTCWVQGI